MEAALIWTLALSVTLVSYTMAHIVDQPSWYSRIANLVILPSEFQSFVRMVSLLCVSFALALILPLVALITYDFVLWIWRLMSTPSIAVEANDTIETDPTIPGTSKSEVTGAELEEVHVWDKPAND